MLDKKRSKLILIVIGALLAGCLTYRLCQYAPVTVTLEMETSRAGLGQVFFDAGRGYNEADSSNFLLASSAPAYTVASSRERIAKIRIDPMNVPGYFHIQRLHLSTWFAQQSLGPAELAGGLQPVQQVAEWRTDAAGVGGLATGADPVLEWKLPPPDNQIPRKTRLLLAAVMALTVGAVLALAAFGANQPGYSLTENWPRRYLARQLARWPSGRHKSFLRRCGVGIMAFLFLLMSMNLLLDPFAIFHWNVFPYEFQINQRYNKIRFLEKNHDRFNTYLFGSSRMASTDPALIASYLPGAQAYNFSLFGGMLADNLVHVRFFLQRGYPLETLYLQVDQENMMRLLYPDTDPLNRYHPLVKGDNLLNYYFSYLTIVPKEHIQGKLKYNLAGRADKLVDVENSGQTLEWKFDGQIANDHEKFIAGQEAFHRQIRTRVGSTAHAVANLAALSEIKQLCDERNIRLIVFTSPPHRVTLDAVIVADYQDFVRRMAQITPFWDFSYYNSVTNDDHYYYEESHYRPVVGELIAARIFKDTARQVPADFGVYVTADNVDEHLHNLAAQFAAVDRAKWLRR